MFTLHSALPSEHLHGNVSLGVVTVTGHSAKTVWEFGHNCGPTIKGATVEQLRYRCMINVYSLQSVYPSRCVQSSALSSLNCVCLV